MCFIEERAGCFLFGLRSFRSTGFNSKGEASAVSCTPGGTIKIGLGAKEDVTKKKIRQPVCCSHTKSNRIVFRVNLCYQHKGWMFHLANKKNMPQIKAVALYRKERHKPTLRAGI